MEGNKTLSLEVAVVSGSVASSHRKTHIKDIAVNTRAAEVTKPTGANRAEPEGSVASGTRLMGVGWWAPRA